VIGGQVLEGLGVVFVEEEVCLVLDVVGAGGLEILMVSSEVFLMELLVVTTFCDKCTSSISSLSPP
jgi:hypothetical protein